MLKEVKDLFILEAYFSLSPAVRVDFCFYEPARSTKCIFEVLPAEGSDAGGRFGD